MPDLTTLAGPHRTEIDKVRGSRFFATASPAADEAAARALVAALRAEFPDATHHCWAWRGEGKDDLRYSDDGEPNGSAGRPILHAIDGRSLQRVAVVVTRYYGGTKLGAGGLVRAYGRAAAAVLDAAAVVVVPRTTRVEARFDYPMSGAVESVARAFDLAPAETEYGAAVSLHWEVRDESVEALVVALTERCAGRIEVVVGSPK